MFRSILIIALGGTLAWLILRLIQTLKQISPGPRPDEPAPLDKGKIIDAEFKELDDD